MKQQHDLYLFNEQQRQITLTTYQRELAQLLLQYKDDLDDDNKTASIVARTITLYALRQLDSVRQGYIIQYLYDLNLITTNHTFVNISAVDLTNTIFPKGVYNSIDLSRTILENATLQQISLINANFAVAIMHNVKLQLSNCTNVNFMFAQLQSSDFTNVDVTNATFSNTNLRGSNINTDQLLKAKTLQGAILPNGTVYSG
ncbi:unnamed protein product [Didymodactylos carnosus]|uniref:Pentapeptide repeat-containing protein n=1 Tax=Didymodactylos carnosus TaxID=1234261 RepID=A0A8S2FCI5_9BILA|nr:unnamed protein product [Didymodactylos carnosus]CAF4224565.1 unnamed protein product [Didymodactylos carnosus]